MAVALASLGTRGLSKASRLLMKMRRAKVAGYHPFGVKELAKKRQGIKEVVPTDRGWKYVFGDESTEMYAYGRKRTGLGVAAAGGAAVVGVGGLAAVNMMDEYDSAAAMAQTAYGQYMLNAEQRMRRLRGVTQQNMLRLARMDPHLAQELIVGRALAPGTMVLGRQEDTSGQPDNFERLVESITKGELNNGVY